MVAVQVVGIRGGVVAVARDLQTEQRFQIHVTEGASEEGSDTTPACSANMDANRHPKHFVEIDN